MALTLYLKDAADRKVLISVSPARQTAAYPHRFDTPKRLCVACFGTSDPQSCYCTVAIWQQLSTPDWTYVVMRQNGHKDWILRYFKGKL